MPMQLVAELLGRMTACVGAQKKGTDRNGSVRLDQFADLRCRKQSSHFERAEADLAQRRDRPQPAVLAARRRGFFDSSPPARKDYSEGQDPSH